MSNSQPSFRWRTLFELSIIASVIYFLVGAPGFNGLVKSSGSTTTVAPAVKSHTRTDAIVYPEANLACESHDYDVHIYSAKPLVIYVDGFLGSEEADALIELR